MFSEIELCDLAQKIPKEKIQELFHNSDASAEMDCTFLGFEDSYRKALEYAPENMVIIDLGCAYATQSWYFKDHVKYIGVDYGTCYDEHPTYEDKLRCVLQTNNSEFYFESIQYFIKNTLPTLALDLNNVFAVCSAVPDTKARQLIRETFPNYLDWYPGESMHIQMNNQLIQTIAEDIEQEIV